MNRTTATLFIALMFLQTCALGAMAFNSFRPRAPLPPPAHLSIAELIDLHNTF